MNNTNHSGLCDHPDCLIAALKGLRNGMYSGGKIRFVHSLVMTILFRSGSFKEKLITIFKLTWEHARNLGCFVGLYKIIVCILKHTFKSKSLFINFISAFFSSYFAFSRDASQVNMQLMLYLLSRNLLAFGNIISERYMNNYAGFTLSSMFQWGFVLFLFEYNMRYLQNSLANTMVFIYKDSDKKYENFLDLIPFEIPKFLIN